MSLCSPCSDPQICLFVFYSVNCHLLLYTWDVSSEVNESWQACGPRNTSCENCLCTIVPWPAACCSSPWPAPLLFWLLTAARELALIVPWGEEGKFLFCHERFGRFGLGGSPWFDLRYWNCPAFTSRAQLPLHHQHSQGLLGGLWPPLLSSSCLASTTSRQCCILADEHPSTWTARAVWDVNSLLLTVESS